jgi:hypothetical protein
MFLSDGRTDTTKVIAAHRKFVNEPKNVKLYKKCEHSCTAMQEGRNLRGKEWEHTFSSFGD